MYKYLGETGPEGTENLAALKAWVGRLQTLGCRR